MKTWKKIILIVGITLIVVLLIIQLPFFRPEKNYTKAEPVDDVALSYDVPMNVLMDLNESCYNCHSNYTEKYPWYYNIQPVGWWMNKHIRDGKKELNFSEFAQYSPKKATKKFKEIKKDMDNHTMPLKSYLWLHDDAKMSEKQYKRVAAWAGEMHDKLMDSIQKQ